MEKKDAMNQARLRVEVGQIDNVCAVYLTCVGLLSYIAKYIDSILAIR